MKTPTDTKHTYDTKPTLDVSGDGCTPCEGGEELASSEGATNAKDGTLNGHFGELFLTVVTVLLIASPFDPEFYVSTGSFAVLGASMALSLVGTLLCCFDLFRCQRSRFHEEAVRLLRRGHAGEEVPVMRGIFHPQTDVPRMPWLSPCIWISAIPILSMADSIMIAMLRSIGSDAGFNLLMTCLDSSGPLTLVPLLAEHAVLLAMLMVYVYKTSEYDKVLLINATGSADKRPACVTEVSMG